VLSQLFALKQMPGSEGSDIVHKLGALLARDRPQIFVDTSGGGYDAEGELNFGMYSRDVLQAIQVEAKQGKSINQMFDPNDKENYVGRFINAHRLSMGEMDRRSEKAMPAGMFTNVPIGNTTPAPVTAPVMDLTTQSGILKAYENGDIDKTTASRALVMRGFGVAGQAVPTPH
jgi:hypothetical protein